MMFTHLRAYSTYSIGYGAMQVNEYVKRVKALGMTACALTEKGVLYSAIEFMNKCKAEGIQPILGMDVQVIEPEGLLNVLVLAENDEGYYNLVKLATAMQKNKVNGQPAATLSDLEDSGRRGNLILLTGHRTSKYGNLLLRHRMPDADALLQQYLEWFGKGNVYLEVQHHAQLTDAALTARIVLEGKKHGVPVVLTNQTLHAVPETARKHVLIRAVIEGSTDDKVERSVLPSCHVRSAEEMVSLFPQYPELIANTDQLRSRIQIKMDSKQKFHPHAIIPEGETEMSHLRKEVEIGFQKKFGHLDPDSAEFKSRRERLEAELPVVEKTGYPGYLLIVSDFIRWALANGYDVGPGRGSGAGSITLDCLDITDVDPVQWDLIFERFLNVERVSDPDIDTDFAPDAREPVVQYCIEKYGADRVASIITFSSEAARASTRDVGRVTGVDPSIVDRIAKMIPKKVGVTIELALGRSDDPEKVKQFCNPDLVDAMSDPIVVKLLEDAMLLEGLIRGTGVHAAGKIISSVPVGDVCPLQYDEESGAWITQFDGPTCEKIGLMKMDFLGLETLTVIRRTLDFVKRTTGKDIDMRRIPFDDKDVFREIYAKGRTVAVFQFESPGMRRLLQDFQPESLEDLILLNAAYRPGPMQFIPDIIANKKEPSQIVYDTESFRDILSPTYGKPVYQEQIMKLFTVAGYSLGEADIIRRGMAKKKLELLIEEKERFLNACVELGMEESRKEEFWMEIVKFAEYAFPKAHAAAYSINSYWTGFLKFHYPTCFFAAAMSLQKLEKIPGLIQEARQMGLEILKPDINKSDVDFTPEGKGVRFGLGRIKGVASAAHLIVENREANGPFESLTDLVRRVAIKVDVMRCLIDAGALDQFGFSRASLMALVEGDWRKIQDSMKKSRQESDQLSLFSVTEFMPDIVPPAVTPWTTKEQFQREFAVLQAYVDGHPVDAMRNLRKDHFCLISDLDEPEDGMEVTILALVDKFEVLKRKKDNKPMAKLKISDGSGQITAMMFTKTYAKYKDKVAEQEIRVFKGRYQYDESDAQIVLEEVSVPAASAMYYVKVPDKSREWAAAVVAVAKRNAGHYPLYLYIEDERSIIPAKQTVSPSFHDDAIRCFGEQRVAAV